MKTLLVLRHAKSSWANSAITDHDRPLNERGKQDAPRMGKLLKEQDLVPEAIITSSAERALTTAELAALSSGFEKEIIVTRNFYHAEAEDYIAYLQRLPDDLVRVMVVGHNPGMEELVYQLTGQYVAMPTAALAQIELPLAQWQLLDESTHGQLVNLWRPREL